MLGATCEHDRLQHHVRLTKLPRARAAFCNADHAGDFGTRKSRFGSRVGCTLDQACGVSEYYTLLRSSAHDWCCGVTSKFECAATTAWQRALPLDKIWQNPSRKRALPMATTSNERKDVSKFSVSRPARTYKTHSRNCCPNLTQIDAIGA